MAETKGPNPAGAFIWYELMTSDANAAARFYGDVVGWTIAGQPDPKADMDYRMIGRDDGGQAGGMLQLSPAMQEHGACPIWLPYFHVADVDAAIAAMAADGANLVMPAVDHEVGRFAMLSDPQGVAFYLMKPKPPAGMENMASDVFAPNTAQHVAWNELASPDLAGAKAFYGKHFGFTFDNVMPMGPMGDYCFIDHHGMQLGAIMQRHDESAPAQWLLYFRVPNVTSAKAAIETGGGTVTSGPHEVPGGDHVVMAIDPQGARFGVVGALA
ncbi:VOC family protein [Novosphingobium sp.]|uniref:VOC family protein n=1 Tax=Novosphingobium sp. TaxID=1874826 RepID=UPI0025D7CC22|nr:VOC family protein [Novosphingobium sp.]